MDWIGGKTRYSFFRGRILIVISCLRNNIIYLLSLYKALGSIVRSLKRMMRDFHWKGIGRSKMDHLISWEKIKLLVEQGAVGDLRAKTTALLGK